MCTINGTTFRALPCMYRACCTVYYPDQQMHNIYINNILQYRSTHGMMTTLTITAYKKR